MFMVPIFDERNAMVLPSLLKKIEKVKESSKSGDGKS